MYGPAKKPNDLNAAAADHVASRNFQATWITQLMPDWMMLKQRGTRECGCRASLQSAVGAPVTNIKATETSRYFNVAWHLLANK